MMMNSSSSNSSSGGTSATTAGYPGYPPSPQDDPEWWKKTSIYQVYPRSFQDSNADGIGDLEGILSRLDYLQDLGVDTIWFSPFHKSPQRDFGYDCSDHFTVDPCFGNMETFHKLVKEIHRRGMKIVMDMVLNHTSDQHPWFMESRSSVDNPKRDWYIWRKGKAPGVPPNNWNSMIQPNGWNYDAETDEWYFSTFLRFQPDLNYHNVEVKKAMLDVCRFWLRQGIDGFRLDIFNAIYKDPEFRDNPFFFQLYPTETSPGLAFQKPVHTINHPLTYNFAKELRAAIDAEAPPTRFLLGEVSGGDDVLKNFLGGKNDGLNLVFMFQTLEVDYSAAFFRNLLQRFETMFAEPFCPVIVYGNHDKVRYLEQIKGDRSKAKIMAVFQMTTRAVPVIYQGEEIGMRQAPFSPPESAKDPLPHTYSWIPRIFWKYTSLGYINRDGCRTPMQWDASSPNAGFTAENATPWLRVQDNYPEVNVATQLQNPESLLRCYRALLHLRKQRPALRQGTLEMVSIPRTWFGAIWQLRTPQVVAYRREYETDLVVVVLNCESYWAFDQRIPLPFHQCGFVLFSTQPDLRNMTFNDATDIFLKSGQAVILGNRPGTVVAI